LGYPLNARTRRRKSILGSLLHRRLRARHLPTQLFFLLHRARQLADMPSGGLLDQSLVADFLMEKDELFAKLTLDAQEFCALSANTRQLEAQPANTRSGDLSASANAMCYCSVSKQRGLEAESQDCRRLFGLTIGKLYRIFSLLRRRTIAHR
jgi:hypothetical protein